MKRLALASASYALAFLAIGPQPPALCADTPNATDAMVYSASDMPRLADGIALAAGDERTLRVWAPSNQAWTLSREDDLATLKSSPAAGDATPRWLDLGRVQGTIKLVVAGPVSADAKPKEGETPPPPPAPALIVFEPDPKGDPARLLEIARGVVDSTAPSPDRRREQSRTNKEGANFHAPATVEEWRERGRHLREQMKVSLGLWPEPPKTPLNPQVYGRLERDGYTIEKVVLETLPGFTLSGNLYRPKSVAAGGSLPAILCPHGHWEDGRLRDDVQHRCIRWAKLGAVVFMYDMVGYNDSRPFTHEFLNERLRRWGLSLFALQTWNSIRALDWIASLPDVDPARIGCTGESGGGTQTFILTALDDRIKVAAPVVMVSEWFQGGCVCENAAGLRIGTDNIEFAALCAPRPMVLVGATGDWTAKTMTRAFPAIRGAYSLVGSPDRVEASVFDFPHNYNQTTRNAVYAFMGRWLLGLDPSVDTREGEQTVEKPEAILTFDAQHPASPDRKNPQQLEDHLIHTIRAQLEALSPERGPTVWQAARPFLATSHRVRVGVAIPSPEKTFGREVRRISREGLTIVHAQVGRRGEGDAIPVVRITPAHTNGRLTMIADDRGKLALVKKSGELSDLVRALLDRGQSVVGFDPLFVGESLDADRPVGHRPLVAHGLTYNPAVAADQMQDLATVLTWAGSQPDVREVSLVASGLSGRQALLARPLLGNLARTVVDLDGGGDDDYYSDNVPAAIDLPGVHQFGGLRAAAALSAPTPLRIVRPGEEFAQEWPQAAYELAGSPGALKFDTDPIPAVDLARWIDAGE
ncbi:alpha/beta hydrolase family protein [Paludisphaera mucosa]|uniref:Acetylxylan esterase n=1 Tax=Paludisphaera mucosa TaxID=3030827 RepID=A0ABT6F727_9BACT|nr:acetylxylan esterase [Paludisphaera mucosa]MDG3003383.1 acetylxylan esterase [Paludisphaera mucosa]